MSPINHTYWEIVIAALLHDVGKIGQRAFGPGEGLSEQTRRMEHSLTPQERGYSTHLHVLYTNEFFNLIEDALPLDLDRPTIINSSVRHHRPQSSDKSELIRQADSIASGMEREPKELSSVSTVNYRETRLVSICSRVRLPGVDPGLEAEHILSLWDENADVLFPVQQSPESLRGDYRRLWDALIERFKLLKGLEPEAFVAGALDILEASTWCVPSATNEIPDISLFDHSRAVAAVAGCLTLTDENDEPFLLVGGDFGGIQKYIFDLQYGTGAVAKTLRARSFTVSLFSDHVCMHLLKSSGTSLVHRILTAGGRLYMLLPHNKEMRKLVDDARERLDQWSLRETDGELRYSLADLPLSIDALKQFGSALQRLNDELESCKKIPLSRSLTTEKRWHEEAFIRPQIQFRQDEALCDSCRRRPGSKGDFRGHEIHICPRCATERRIGAIIPKRRAVILHGEPSGDGPSLPFFESSMPDLMAKSSGNAEAVFHWKPVHERRSGLTIFVRKATYVPMDREGVMEFDEIAARAKGRHLLGYVKADVDNLGYLMARGLDYEFKRSSTDEPISRQSLSRVATLSRMLEGFFSGFVENICSKKYSSMYIVYSGGDDLLAIGPWDESLLFVSELRKKFREFTGDNAAFGLSAGVAIVQPRTPLLHAVEQAEQSLETAKSYRRKESKRTKDAIAIFGEAIEWPAFEKAISQGQQLAEWTRNNIISVGKVRRLMEYARMFDVYRKDPENTSQLRFITLLIYDLNRNWTGRTLEHQKAKEWAQQLANPSFGDLSALTLACNYSLLSNR